MVRLLLATALFGSSVALAAPVPATPDVAKDRDGNPLPPGATARLGSLAFSANGSTGLWYSADGRSLYTWSDNAAVIGWDAQTGRRLDRGPYPFGEKFVGYYPVVAGERLLRFHDAYSDAPFHRSLGGAVTVGGPDGKEVSRFEYGPNHIPNVSATPDGKYAADVFGSTVAVFDLDTGKRVFEHELAAGGTTRVQLAPDGKTVFVVRWREAVRRFALPGGKELPSLDTDGTALWLAVSPDGKTAVVPATDATKLVVYDLTMDKPVGTLAPGRCSSARFIGPDALVVASTAYRAPGPFIESLSRWNLKTFQKEWQTADDGELAISPDGTRLAVSSRMNVRVLDAATGKRVDAAVRHFGPVRWIEFSADGETVTTHGRSEVMTWARTGVRKAVAEPAELRDGWADRSHTDSPRAWVGFSADGKTRELVGWNVERHAVAWRMPLGADLPDRVFTHDGKRVVGVWPSDKRGEHTVAAFDGPVGKVTGRWTLTLPPDRNNYTRPSLAGDGKTLFVGDADGVRGLDAETGKEVVRVKTGPVALGSSASELSRVAVAPDGTRVAVAQRANQRDGTVYVFDVKASKQLAWHDLAGTDQANLLFDPSGSHLAILAGPRVQVIDATGAAKPRTFDANGAWPTCVAFSPDGKTLAVGYADGTTLLWDLAAK